MRLERASYKATKYACINFHYAKKVPVSQSCFSVFNSSNEWCGVIIYGIGANNGLAKSFGLKNGQVAELLRVALNGKQELTSKAVAISMKLVAKSNPLVKLLVSFADKEQGHKGTIYQATNWIFAGDSDPAEEYLYQGKRWHGRAFRSSFGSHLKYKDKGLKIIMGSSKHRYIYPLDKALNEMCNKLSKPYPKKCDVSRTANAASFQLAEDGQHDHIALSI